MSPRDEVLEGFGEERDDLLDEPLRFRAGEAARAPQMGDQLVGPALGHMAVEPSETPNC